MCGSVGEIVKRHCVACTSTGMASVWSGSSAAALQRIRGGDMHVHSCFCEIRMCVCVTAAIKPQAARLRGGLLPVKQS